MHNKRPISDHINKYSKVELEQAIKSSREETNRRLAIWVNKWITKKLTARAIKELKDGLKLK